jgi:hypothetical protein
MIGFHRMTKTLSCLLVVSSLIAAACSLRVEGQVGTASVTAFEGARLITGDGGAPIENSVSGSAARDGSSSTDPGALGRTAGAYDTGLRRARPSQFQGDGSQ